MANTLASNTLPYNAQPMPRRGFIKAVGVAIAGSLLLAAQHNIPGSVSLARAGTRTPLRATFAPYVGDTFHVQLDASDSVALELVKVRDLRSAQALAARGRTIDPEQNFSILFRGPVDRPLIQDIYRFEHMRSGSFALFMVPMRPEQDGRYYEVIFNRLREEG